MGGALHPGPPAGAGAGFRAVKDPVRTAAKAGVKVKVEVHAMVIEGAIAEASDMVRPYLAGMTPEAAQAVAGALHHLASAARIAASEADAAANDEANALVAQRRRKMDLAAQGGRARAEKQAHQQAEDDAAPDRRDRQAILSRLPGFRVEHGRKAVGILANLHKVPASTLRRWIAEEENAAGTKKSARLP